MTSLNVEILRSQKLTTSVSKQTITTPSEPRSKTKRPRPLTIMSPFRKQMKPRKVIYHQN